jgi:hypothetical protein
MYLLGRSCGDPGLSQKLTTAQIWNGIVGMKIHECGGERLNCKITFLVVSVSLVGLLV